MHTDPFHVFQRERHAVLALEDARADGFGVRVAVNNVALDGFGKEKPARGAAWPRLACPQFTEAASKGVPMFNRHYRNSAGLLI